MTAVCHANLQPSKRQPAHVSTANSLLEAFVAAVDKSTPTNQRARGKNAKQRFITSADKVCWHQAEMQGSAVLRWRWGCVSARAMTVAVALLNYVVVNKGPHDPRRSSRDLWGKSRRQNLIHKNIWTRDMACFKNMPIETDQHLSTGACLTT